MNVISVEHLSKAYRLGQIGTGTLSYDLKVWWAKARGKPNPMLKIGQEDHGNRDGETIWALRDISFTVEQGEVLGIIGRNGAGKSTLLKILSRVTAPTSGRVKVKGRIASLLEVGTGFHPDLTGRENIYLNGAILGMTKDEVRRKFDEIVDFAEIEQFIDTPVKRYSSGMYVRLAFAVAAHLEPEILLVDEVLAVGDAEFQKKCLGKMGEVANEGRTILFVSHNMAAVQALCKKGIVLRYGINTFEGTSLEAVQRYLQDVTRLQSLELSNRTDRRGSNAVRIVRVKFIDERSNQEASCLISGMPVLIECEYEKRDAAEIKNFDISIGFFTQLGVLMFACRSSAQGRYFDLEKSTGKLYCRIPKWPLAAGVYIYNIYSESKGIILDWIQDAGRINVEAGDFYGTGKLPANTVQSVFVDYEWISGD